MKKQVQVQLVKAFIAKNSLVVGALSKEAVQGFSRGVAQGMGVSVRVAFSQMKKARLA